MEKEIIYICEFCHARFDNEKSCLECEKSHPTQIKAIRAEYDYNDPAPDILYVKFSNGLITSYLKDADFQDFDFPYEGTRISIEKE